VIILFVQRAATVKMEVRRRRMNTKKHEYTSMASPGHRPAESKPAGRVPGRGTNHKNTG